ncbi:hypothetical protein [Spodoptera cosmioides nucleopolyhedrovirus]|uniref:Uncharacterized protein n=1 Tax=Spodoptera cosmioides nucleopolyhedrovirus TaxID=2605774 RepID=A0A6B7KIA7_9ABAC|nr:hypothetical protein [Spodoptera cosmioides nucleopolyhedrovirus]
MHNRRSRFGGDCCKIFFNVHLLESCMHFEIVVKIKDDFEKFYTKFANSSSPN